jgi:hypothetical protein
VMMHLAKLLKWKGKNKAKERKPMVVERGKTCSRSKKKSNFNRVVGNERCISIFTDKVWKVTKGSLLIQKGEKVGTLYLCNGNTESSISLASIGLDTSLWHHRLRHMSEKGMQIRHKINLFLDLKQIDLDFCEHYVYGKQKRVRFLRIRKEKKSERLELVHTDVWGLAQVSSLSGSPYYVTFIDDVLALDQVLRILAHV